MEAQVVFKDYKGFITMGNQSIDHFNIDGEAGKMTHNLP